MKISRDIALPIAAELAAIIGMYCERVEIAGSLRRGNPEVKDIELVAVPRWEEVQPAHPVAHTLTEMLLFEDAQYVGDEKREPEKVNLLYQWAMQQQRVRWIKPGTSEIIDWMPKPEGKYWRGIVDGKIKLDLFLAQASNFGIIYVIRTGSQEFSTALMSHAKMRGYPCINGFLHEQGQPVATPDEQSVFNILGLRYVEPRLRTDGNAVKTAARY